MIEVEVFEGEFDGGDVIGPYKFPAMPRIGEEVSFGQPKRRKVLAVHYHFSLKGDVLFRIAVERLP